MHDPQGPPAILILLLPLIWCATIFLIGRLGAWGRIAAQYPAWNAFEGRRWRGQSAQVGWGNYGGCLTVGANQRGLHVNIFVLMRPGHPPLFVPWEDVSATTARQLFRDYVDLRFRRVPEVRFRIPKRLAEKLQEEVGSRWPLTPSTR